MAEGLDTPSRTADAGIARRLATAALDRVPAGRAARVFLLVAFVDACGRGLFLAGSALFFTDVLGLTTAQIGTGLSLAGLTGLACAVPIGRLADRFGDWRTLVALQLWRAAGFVVYPLASGFPAFLAIACYIGAVEQAVGPVIQSVAGSVAEGESQVRTMALVAVVRNVAYALSALAATVVIAGASPSFYVAFVLGNAVAFVVTAVLLVRLRLAGGRRDGDADVVRAPAARLPLTDLPFLVLTVANGILYLHVAILGIAFPLWIVTKTSAPDSLVGIVLVVNTVMAVTLQVRLSAGGDDIRRAGRKQRQAGLALAGFCAIAAVSDSVGPVPAAALLLAATVAMTLGELWQSAGAWGISYGLAPPSRRAYYLSAYQIGATGLTVLGPAVLTVAVVDTGAVGWIGLAVVFLVAGTVVPVVVPVAARRAFSP